MEGRRHDRALGGRPFPGHRKELPPYHGLERSVPAESHSAVPPLVRGCARNHLMQPPAGSEVYLPILLHRLLSLLVVCHLRIARPGKRNECALPVVRTGTAL